MAIVEGKRQKHIWNVGGKTKSCEEIQERGAGEIPSG